MSTPSSADIAVLRRAVAGPVHTSAEPSLAAEAAAFNTATVHRPAVVVGAACPADVATAVAWAIRHGLPVAVQSTGHGAETPVEGGVLIATGRLRQVSVDPGARTARIGAGARWSDVLAAAAPHGLSPLSGSSPDVGAVGYVLGGGLPILGRTFGFGADLVRSFEVVTADGSVRHVDAGSEPDLFWALRGGRGAFGVVTGMVVDLLPLTTIHGGALVYPGESAAAILHAWREWVVPLPDATSTSVAIKRFPRAPFVPAPMRGRCVVELRVAHVGPAEEGSRLLAPMRAVAPVIEDTVADIPYTGSAAVYRDPTAPIPHVHQGSTLAGLSPAAVDALLAVAGPEAALPLAVVELRHLGGALARPSHAADAIPGRDAAFTLRTIGVLTPPVADAVRPAGRAVHAALRPWSARGCLLTFLGEATVEEVARLWPADVYRRLRQVKAAYDPQEVFRHGHRIPPAAEGPRAGAALAGAEVPAGLRSPH